MQVLTTHTPRTTAHVQSHASPSAQSETLLGPDPDSLQNAWFVVEVSGMLWRLHKRLSHKGTQMLFSCSNPYSWLSTSAVDALYRR